MCTEKKTLNNGFRINCGHCEQCLLTKKNDWVGRLIAEWKTCSGQVDFVTLTYGGDMRYYDSEVLKNPRAVNFFYEDTVEWRHRIKNNSDGCRFFTVGECGSEKGRVHWHVLVFWNGEPVPNIRYDERYLHMVETPEQARARVGRHWRKGKPLWNHGWSFWEKVSGHGPMEYLCKYLTKSNELNGVDLNGFKHTGLSSKPPIGSQWFRECARRWVDAHLSPNDWMYQFPDVRDGEGRRRKFFLPKGATRDNYLGEFVALWQDRYGHNRWPYSKPVEFFLDKLSGHFADGYDRLDQDERFRMQQFDRAGRMLPLLRTKVEERRWRFEDIGNDMIRFDDDSWALPELAKGRYRAG